MLKLPNHRDARIARAPAGSFDADDVDLERTGEQPRQVESFVASIEHLNCLSIEDH